MLCNCTDPKVIRAYTGCHPTGKLLLQVTQGVYMLPEFGGVYLVSNIIYLLKRSALVIGDYFSPEGEAGNFRLFKTEIFSP